MPWNRKWQPTPVFLPGKFHGQRSLAGCGPWGSQKIRHNWWPSAYSSDALEMFPGFWGATASSTFLIFSLSGRVMWLILANVVQVTWPYVSSEPKHLRCTEWLSLSLFPQLTASWEDSKSYVEMAAWQDRGHLDHKVNKHLGVLSVQWDTVHCDDLKFCISLFR